MALALAVPLVGVAGGTSSAEPADPAEQRPAAGEQGEARREAAPGSASGRQESALPAQQQAPEQDGAAAGAATSSERGDTSEPQPLSGADQNGTGANPGETCEHAYCSDREGLPSGNGNGDGEATGRPCAGCVGAADNKNPPGQAPDRTDGNAGYECDTNSGIARSNPAHTGCTTTSVPPVVPPTVVPPEVLSSTLTRNPLLPTALAPQPLVRPAVASAGLTAVQPRTLPFTGAPVDVAVPVAGGLLLLGLALVAAGRRPAGQV